MFYTLLYQFSRCIKLNTVKFPVSVFFVFLVWTVFPGNRVMAQNGETRVKNFIGLTGIFDISNLSQAMNIEYERELLQKGRFSLSARADIFIPYQTENSFLTAFNITGGNYSVFADDYRLSQVQAWGTAYCFTGTQKQIAAFTSAQL